MSPSPKPLIDFAVEEQIELIRAELDVTKKELGSVRKVLQKTLAENETLELVAKYSGRAIKPPKWLRVPKKSATHHATICSIFSDSHLDEVVNPAEINNVNAYSREIAEMRLRKYSNNLIKISRDYLTGLDFDGAVIFLGGDMVAGTLHEDAETNFGTAPESVVHWGDLLAAMLTQLANEFGKIHCPCVVGNHGRLDSSKPSRMKGRAKNNWDWMLYQQLARYFHNDERVTFDITEGSDVMTEIYSHRFLLSHGDQVTGGGGVGGIWPPVWRMLLRKRQREDFDVMCIGHFHQLIMAPSQGLIVNGSSKGYDQFASNCNFAIEPPQQAMWITTPEHLATFSAPIFVADREAEGW